MLVITVAIENSLYLSPSQAKGKFLYPLKQRLKKFIPQKVYTQLHPTFLFSSITITQLLPVCLKIELNLLFVSEIEKFHTLALNFGGRPFGVTVTRYFSPKPGHANEKYMVN